MILSMAGGGVPLNFKIVTYKTEEAMKDATPAENTIGIVTKEISEYVFSAMEPPDPVDDMLWIKVGTSSPGAFNALKKNAIQICPLHAKQYVSGSWVDVVAMNYLGGNWVKWTMDVIIYDSGATDVALDMTANVNDSKTYLAVSLGLHGGATDSAYARALVHLSGQKELYVSYSNLSGGSGFPGSGGVRARVWDKDGNILTVDGKEYSSTKSTKSSDELKLDISDLNGEYMVGVYANNSSGSSTGTLRVKSIKVLKETAS